MLSNLRNRVGMSAADVDDMAGCERALHRQSKRTRHIAHVHEIALLPAVLKYQGSLAMQQARTEVGEDAGVWI